MKNYWTTPQNGSITIRPKEHETAKLKFKNWLILLKTIGFKRVKINI